MKLLYSHKLSMVLFDIFFNQSAAPNEKGERTSDYYKTQTIPDRFEHPGKVYFHICYTLSVWFECLKIIFLLMITKTYFLFC